MAITKLLSGLPDRTMEQSAFDTAYAKLMTDLPVWGGEVNALAGNLNSIAAGGAYAIPYTFIANDVSNGVANVLSFVQGSGGAAGSPVTATAILVDRTTAGANVSALLLSMSAGTSAVKGHVKVTKQGDAAKWAAFSVTDYAHQSSAYGRLNVTPIAQSSASPFANGDAVVLHFQRTGDKGDSSALTPVLWVRDEKSSGQGGGTSATSQQRTLNTVKKNTITGASLSADVITLPAGTYRLTASVPSHAGGAHRANALITVGGVGSIVTGQSAYAPGSSMIPMSEFTVTGTATVTIQHNTPNTAANGLGAATNIGGSEVYTDVFIEKVS